MRHIRSVTCERPATAQTGNNDFLQKLTLVEAAFSLLVFLRDVVGLNLLGKDAPTPAS